MKSRLTMTFRISLQYLNVYLKVLRIDLLCFEKKYCFACISFQCAQSQSRWQTVMYFRVKFHFMTIVSFYMYMM